MITGDFDRASLTFVPDRPWAAAIQAAVRKNASSNGGGFNSVAAELAAHYAYDYGPESGRVPKSYRDANGRRIVYGWVGGGCCPPGVKNQSWQGVQTVPRVITPSAADDPTTVRTEHSSAENLR
jgi:sucrose-6-phosphate hydrolase SacC (GH32 family)|eukprot:COSAG06_NODE_7180_length_2596_cov_8.948338_2_plen_124_part_00